MADITISGRVVFSNDAPIEGARIRIWETDSGRNADDLILDELTDSSGAFSGSGDWKDSRTFVDVGTFRYQVDFEGQRKTGGSILNPHNFFSTVDTGFAAPAGVQGPAVDPAGTITIAGVLTVKDGGAPVEGARVRIWEVDSGTNDDDLIVDATTGADGRFTGTGVWRDRGRLEVARYRYRVERAGDDTKTGTNILNPHNFFRVLKVDWPDRSTVVWTNWLDDFATDIPAANFRQPRTRAELRAALTDAVAQGLQVKVVGSGHSHSRVAQPEEGQMVINLHEFSGPVRSYPWLPVPVAKLPDQPKLVPQVNLTAPDRVRVRAGTRIRELNREILAPQRKALVNMGPFDGQTISGAINTNTHGTGLGTGGFADMVVSMEMLVVLPRANGDHTVEIWVIEPSDGISDPARFAAQNNDPARRLKQNDDLFAAAVCGYGLFGVAVTYTLEVREEYWLDQVQVRTTWRTLKNEIEALDLRGSDDARSAQTKMYVHVARAIRQGGMTDDTPCRRDDWNEVEVEDQPSNWNDVWPPARPGNGGAGVADFVSGTTFDITGRPSAANATLLGAAFFTTKNRNFFAGDREASSYYRAIRRTVDDTLSVDPNNASDPIDNTIASGPPETSDHALTIELAVPIADTAAAVEAAVDSMVNQNINFLIPIGIRFTRASEQLLCPTAGRDTAFIELSGYLPGTRRRAWERFSGIYRSTFDQILEDVRAVVPSTRVHLGKYHPDTGARFSSDYAGFARWVELYGWFNRSGIFDSPISRRWDLDSHTAFATHAQARQAMLDL